MAPQGGEKSDEDHDKIFYRILRDNTRKNIEYIRKESHLNTKKSGIAKSLKIFDFHTCYKMSTK